MQSAWIPSPSPQHAERPRLLAVVRAPNPALSFEDAQGLWGAELARRLRDSVTNTGLVGEMVSYQLASGGKRIRLLLPAWGTANLGGRPEDAFAIGVGLELLHNATLAFDDLQDGDRFRRGVPTVWSRWGAAQAINAGNALIFESLAAIGRAPAGARVAQAVCKLMLRVVEGQAMEFQIKLPAGDPAAIPPTLDAWREVAERKTGAFFATCFQAAAIVAGAGERVIEESADFGFLLGRLYQAQDDYLDLIGEKGRETRCSDLAEGKLSYPLAWAYAHAPADDATALRAIVDRAREEKTPQMIADAFALLERTGALAATAAALWDLYDQAVAHPQSAHYPELAARVLAPVLHALPERP